MNIARNPGFFRTVADPQSYLNILYLLLAFPLGVLYFVFLVTGLSLGLGLSITLAGIPILLFVLDSALILCKLERFLAVNLLRVDVPTPPGRAASQGLWQRVKTGLSDRLVWTGSLYLFLKFPIGIAAFTTAVTLLAISIGFTFAPAYMWLSDPLVWGNIVLHPYPAAWVLSAIGIIMVFVSLHLLNSIAALLGTMTRNMLGKVR